MGELLSLTAKKFLRATVNFSINFVGKTGLNSYIRLVHNIPFGLNDDTKLKLLSLPKKVSTRVVVNLGYCSFEYLTFPEDDLQIATRSNLKHWEPRTLAFFYENAKSARTILDIGGYTGVYSVIAGKASVHSKIHVFEPSHSTVAKLKENINLNNLGDRISVHNVALSNGKGNLFSYSTEEEMIASTNRVSRIPSVNARSVVHSSLDSFQIENVDLIKIDVEGFESEVINGAEKTIERFKPVIIMECLDQKELDKISQMLISLSYCPPIQVGFSDGDEKNFIWVASSD